jgi:hypothetical protein
MTCYVGMDEMIPWGDDPSKKDPVDPGHHALTLYTLSLYPPRREYWWELYQQDCNPGHELGSCKTTGACVTILCRTKEPDCLQ